MSSRYENLSREQIERRLAAAEDVVVLWSWSAALDGERDKAAYMRWRDWLLAGGSSEAKDNPHLTDKVIARLAAERDEIHRRTIASIERVFPEIAKAKAKTRA